MMGCSSRMTAAAKSDWCRVKDISKKTKADWCKVRHQWEHKIWLMQSKTTSKTKSDWCKENDNQKEDKFRLVPSARRCMHELET